MRISRLNSSIKSLHNKVQAAPAEVLPLVYGSVLIVHSKIRTVEAIVRFAGYRWARVDGRRYLRLITGLCGV